MVVQCINAFQYMRRISPMNRRFLSLLASRNSAEQGVPYKDNVKERTSAAPSDVPKEADVVVIGGGSLGCSTLYNLAKLGITNTVLLEAHQITAGTTWHTAGLVWRLRPNDTEIQLLKKTLDIILSLEAESGINPGWINNGGLFIASSKERLDEYKRLMTIGKANDIESFVLGPSETKKLYPLMNVDDVYGTLYSPGDGTIEPAGLCTALTRIATRAGAKVIEKCPVVGIQTESSLLGGKQISEVLTPFGAIKTNCVVNAAGCWSNHISNLVGIEIPLVAMKHSYVVTDKIPGIENMPNIRDHDSSIYLRLQGDALSVGGYEMNPIILDKMDKDFSFGLFDLDWNVFSVHIEKAMKRVPELERTGIKSTVCGPESFTPDHKPLMGEDPNVLGFYHCCGFNSAGMMLGGGCGHQMAHWVTKGRPELDMFGYDIRRFNPSSTSSKNWVLERSHEAYAKNYSIVFPHDEPLAGRGQKKIPLHSILEENGCIFQERHGWERPGWFNTSPAPIQPYDWYGAYDNPSAKDSKYKDMLTADYTFGFPPHHHIIHDECLAARTRAALFDMSYFGQVYMTGEDAQKAADWLFTANMQKKPDSVVYTCMLNQNGGIEADLTVSIVDSHDTCPYEPKFEGRGFYLAIGGAATHQNWSHIIKEIRRNKWNVNLHNYSDNMGVLSLQGPLSRDILQQITDSDLSNEAFPFSTHKIITVAGHRVRALRLSFVGELGWELHVPSTAAIPIYEALHKAGKSFKLINAGYRALDSLSLEKGYVLWHADARIDDSPLEAGLGFACKLKTSTPFLGRDSLNDQKKIGLKKKLVTFTLKDKSVSILGLEAILRDGEPVGFIRRGEFAFHLGTSIAVGYVKRPDGKAINNEFLKSGNWELEVMGEPHAAILHTKSPFDPNNLRIKGIYNPNSELKK